MNHNKKILFYFTLNVILSLASESFPAQANISFESILLAIQSREERLETVSYDSIVTLPKHNDLIHYKNSHKLKGAKEYIHSDVSYVDSDVTQVERFAFNGKLLQAYNERLNEGWITTKPIDDTTFFVRDSILMFWGYSFGNFCGKGHTLSALLKNSENILVSPGEKINGFSTYLISGDIYFAFKDNNQGNHYEVWLSPEMDFVPVRIELHYFFDQRELEAAGVDPRPTLMRLYHNIKYEYDDKAKIWFPIQGEFVHYNTSPKFKEGLSKEAIKKLGPSEMIKYFDGWEVDDGESGPHKIEVTNFEINIEIPDDEFNIKYPGTALVNDVVAGIVTKPSDLIDMDDVVGKWDKIVDEYDLKSSAIHDVQKTEIETIYESQNQPRDVVTEEIKDSDGKIRNKPFFYWFLVAFIGLAFIAAILIYKKRIQSLE